MPSYYQTLGIFPYFVTFVPGSLYTKGKEIQNRVLRVVLNDYKISSRFTECSLSPNFLYGSHMKTIATEMFKCMNTINPTN